MPYTDPLMAKARQEIAAEQARIAHENATERAQNEAAYAAHERAFNAQRYPTGAYVDAFGNLVTE